MNAVPRVVLDTNVCLDLYVFGNPDCATLHAALRAGTLAAITTDACRAEWQRVLDYPQLALDTLRRETASAAFDAQLQLLPPPADVPALPSCSDPDDQKFLELAASSGASHLLSRDKALLKLARRTRRDHGFDILTPRDYALTLAVSAKPV